MIDTQTETGGAFSKTSGYNFLKTLLGVPKKATINKHFFALFFDESGGFYFLKKPEDLIRSIFTDKGICELNKLYFEKKKDSKTEEASEIAKKVLAIVKESLAA